MIGRLNHIAIAVAGPRGAAADPIAEARGARLAPTAHPEHGVTVVSSNCRMRRSSPAPA